MGGRAYEQYRSPPHSYSQALFAPGNLRAVTEHPGYASLIAYWHENRYQLRYTGGMVSDVMQLIVKGKGATPPPLAGAPRRTE